MRLKYISNVVIVCKSYFNDTHLKIAKTRQSLGGLDIDFKHYFLIILEAVVAAIADGTRG